MSRVVLSQPHADGVMDRTRFVFIVVQQCWLVPPTPTGPIVTTSRLSCKATSPGKDRPEVGVDFVSVNEAGLRRSTCWCVKVQVDGLSTKRLSKMGSWSRPWFEIGGAIVHHHASTLNRSKPKEQR
jgi:hypothetical protein